MSATTLSGTGTIDYSEVENQQALLAVKTHMIVGLLVFLLMMLAGATMRAAQGNILTVDPDLFYQFLTVHGAGMVGTAGIASNAVLWYFLRQYVRLSTKVFWINFGIFLAGVVLILGSIFLGKYGGAWTFLYPLPGISMGAWSAGAAAAFLLGLLVIGTGFLILYLDMGRAILARYGNFGRALGLPQLFGREPVDTSHPLTIVAGAMVVIANFIGIAVGAVVLVMMLVNLYSPAFQPDALMVKNLIYFFGHVFINATIYASVTAVYELFPRFTGRPWQTSKVFYAAWLGIAFMVMAVYPHHMFMDFNMPRWAMVAAQALSYGSGLPVLAVTGYGALIIVYRSGIKWNTTTSLLFLSMFGWAAGIIPAMLDATVTVNRVYHNTLWVPGHFHFYLLLGVLPMILGFTYYLIGEAKEGGTTLIDRLGFYSFFVGGLLLAFTFLASGAQSVPRRWAVHMDEWISLAHWGTLAAVLVVTGVLLFTLSAITRLPKAPEPS